MFVKNFEFNRLKTEIKEKLYCKLLKGRLFTEVDMIGYDYHEGDKLTGVDVKFYNDDLCLSSFYYNFYRRTDKAVKSERYKTFGQAIKALKLLSRGMGYKINQLKIYNLSYTHIYTINI